MVAGSALLIGQYGASALPAIGLDSVVSRPVDTTVVMVGPVVPVDAPGRGGSPARAADAATSDARDVADRTATGAVTDPAACLPIEAVFTDRSGGTRDLAAAVLFAGGALAAVSLRRRTRLRGAGAGERLPRPSAEAAAIESSLRSLSPLDRLVRLDVTIRAVAATLIDGRAAPSVQVLAAIVHDDGRVDITLSADALPAPPFDAISPDWWRLSSSVALHDVAPIACRAGLPSPALVHLGASEGGELFVDLEALGLLVVDAEAELADPIVRTVAASLCTSPFSGGITLVATGLDPEVLIERPLAEVVESVDAALDLAAISIGSTTGFTSGGSSTFRLRSQGPSEGWDPAVVLVGSSAAITAHEASDLVTLTATPGRGLAVLVGSPVPGARWRLEEAAGRWTLQPLGMVVQPVQVAVDEVEAVRRLLQEAGRPAIAAAPDPLVMRRVAANAPEPVSPPFREQRWSLMVRLLGPVAVEAADGTPAQFDKARSLELIAWLALHRERPSRSGARTALWEADVRDATFANVVSEARRALSRVAAPPSDGEWLARSLGENLPLHVQVVTDADLLEARVSHARRQRPNDAIDTLRQGLEWVRGLPFADTGYLWPDGDGITSRLVLLVTTAAAEMAQRCLEVGDIEGVFWATGRGLTVLPGHEELVGLRMRAHADRGDLSAVRLEWETYLRTLEADAWSDAEPAPKLVALRHDLLGPSSPRSIVGAEPQAAAVIRR
jgi:DNA-binding SARP family transcriptional activator